MENESIVGGINGDGGSEDNGGNKDNGDSYSDDKSSGITVSKRRIF